MDWNAAIEKNREALKRILAMLVAMAGLGGLSSPLAGEDGSARRGDVSAEAQRAKADESTEAWKAKVEAEPLAEPGEGSGSRLTLPRHLHRAVLSLLRPAESAVRRLIIVMARGMVVALPQRPRKPRPTSAILRNGIGTGIVMPRGFRSSAGTPVTRSLALPLTDPLPRWGVRARPAASGFPRISIPGLTRPVPVPRAPSPDDPLDATRLALRLGALASALDNLPREARRFACWKARRDRALSAGRIHRVTPLRPGRPPGGRLSYYDPGARRRKNIRDVDEILAHAHALASYAFSPDTS